MAKRRAWESAAWVGLGGVAAERRCGLLFGTHQAARALLSGPEGSPKQAGGLLGLWAAARAPSCVSAGGLSSSVQARSVRMRGLPVELLMPVKKSPKEAPR